MKIYQYSQEQFLPVSIQQAWEFFSLPYNLERITPPEVKFKTLTKLDDTRIYDGMRISYRLRPLWNIPMSWETVILKVNAPFQFMDKQLKGPYALWEHTHTFEEVAGGVVMKDDIRYGLPFGWFGTIFHNALVKKQLEKIFEFRRKTVERVFGNGTNL